MATATPPTRGETTATPDAHAAPELKAAPSPDHGKPLTLREKIKAFRHRHETAEHVAFFFAGFSFDVLTLERIDSPVVLGQQGTYLFLIGLLMMLEQRHALGLMKPKGIGAKVWSIHEGLMHFFLGTLLSTYTIFYFKAASGFSGLFFMIVLAGLLVANDVPRVRKLGPVVRFALFSLCLTSYFAYVFPVFVGIIRWWLFAAAVIVSTGITLWLYRMVRGWAAKAGEQGKVTPESAKYAALADNVSATRMLVPALVAQVVLVTLYVARITPPVPLAAEFMGAYHSVKRNPEGEGYLVEHERPGWKFWQHGDQSFKARPGDKVFVFARIFAPKRFSDRIFARWSFDDPQRGWIQYDAVPLRINGGKEEGFATWSTKEHYVPGHWKVELETEDRRTIGSLTLDIESSAETEPRVLTAEIR